MRSSRESFIVGSEFTAQASTLDVPFLFGTLQALGSHQPSVLEEDEAFLTMRSKIVRRLPSWQRSGVVSQQCLRLRRLTLVNRVPKLRLEPVWFLFLACSSLVTFDPGVLKILLKKYL